MTDTTTDSLPEVAAAATFTTAEHGSLEARKAFNAALALAQGAFEPIVKNRSVKIVGESKSGARVEYQFRYADLQEIQAKTRPALSAHGLSTTGQLIPSEDGATVIVTLMHAEGFERFSEVFVKYGEDIKKFGAAIKYMRRYMVQTLLDVDADDDLDEDGQGLGDETKTARPPAAPPAGPRRKAPPPPAQQQASDEPPIPPIDEAELASRTQARTENAAAARERVATDTTRAPRDDDTRQIDPAELAREVDRQMNPVDETQQSYADPVGAAQAPVPPADLAEDGERKFLIKRARTRGGDDLMPKVLAELGIKVDPATLDGISKAQWQQIKDKI